MPPESALRYHRSGVPIQRALVDARARVPDCIATSCVDVDHGAIIALASVEPLPRAVIEILASATIELFQGKAVRNVQAHFDEARRSSRKVVSLRDYDRSGPRPPPTTTSALDEVITTTRNVVHIFLRSQARRERVLVLVCRSTVNLGLALHESRTALERVDRIA